MEKIIGTEKDLEEKMCPECGEVFYQQTGVETRTQSQIVKINPNIKRNKRSCHTGLDIILDVEDEFLEQFDVSDVAGKYANIEYTGREMIITILVEPNSEN